MAGWQPVVVDAKLAALRGEAASAGAMQRREAGDDDGGGGSMGAADEVIRIEDEEGHGLGWYPLGEEDDVRVASTSTALNESNKGYQLLQKMGWKGRGLGRNEDGILEPVQTGVDAGVRLGLGKQQQDDHFTNPELISRRLLESEIQANEDEDRRARREMQVERDERIKADVTEILKTFYCQTCNKQYTNAMELEQHLSSYDHHHKKRLGEAKALMADRTRDERMRKEQRRQEKEAAKLHQQIMRAQQQQQQQQQRVSSSASAGPGPGSSQSAAGGAPPAPPSPPNPWDASYQPPLPEQPAAVGPGPPPLPTGAPPSPPGEEVPPPPPLPSEQREAIAFGMGMKIAIGSGSSSGAGAGRGRCGLVIGRGGGLAAGGGGGRGIAGGVAGLSKRPAAPVAAGRGPGQGVQGKAPAMFGDESSDDEEAAAVAAAAAGRRHVRR